MLGWKSGRTPVFLQMETVDCGAAALGIILAFHDCHVPLHELGQQCLVSREGVSLANLVKAAAHFGMNAKVFQNGLPLKPSFPLILFWNRKHYVVLEQIIGSKIYINDPKRGPQILDWETFHAGFSGISLQLSPNTSFSKRAKSKPYVEFLPLLRKQGPSLVILCFFMVITALMSLAPPVFARIFVDHYVFFGLEMQNELQSRLLSLMLLLLLVQVSFCYLQRRIFRRLETKFATWLNSKLIKQLMSLPLVFFSYRRSGDLLYRLQASERLAAAPWSSLCLAFITTFQGFIAVALMFTYCPLLPLIACLCLAAYFLLRQYWQKRWGNVAMTSKAAMTSLTALTASYLTTIAQIKAQCAEQACFVKWEQQLKAFLQAHRESSLANGLMQLFSFFFFSLGYIATTAVGLYCIHKGRMTLGEMMASQILFISFNEAITQHLRLASQQNQVEADLQGVCDIVDYPVEPVITKETGHTLENLKGKIEIIDLTFGFSPEFKPLFKNFNLTINPGQHVAIVGASGSGKSTLMNLIAGLYQPWSGQILIDGKPLAEIPVTLRARLLGVVSQDFFFYKGSLRENLSLWGETYSDSEMNAALQMAAIDDLPRLEPAGFDFQLLEGAVNLSGGQRQRLEIARTLLVKPAILILDEATSALDPIIEARIKTNLRQFPGTRISVAHRLTTIVDAEHIHILKQGHLVASGSYEQLFRRTASV
ncbi:Alpha-hemolysin translocation ATP-binding protein HlyB [Legionella massiliensis]|uniref:Alpha-hemolysin translocation ATP-binding protein HlyB n=1 Tax=Legionella massiliensis TaxID=1034943 RepID=A0A078L0S3_9GAMM|nr:ATP-binding cassette domain-containing protein [Legionella massiliensis]CDZ77628.1 Alpha-hemolysin translocation ATP-binding protein HlyB [Legionella massiliensis]CEE13366.1 Alpha-hemolysin translocation ATP-binding protein HlyB [Legionella massiliensis]